MTCDDPSLTRWVLAAYAGLRTPRPAELPTPVAYHLAAPRGDRPGEVRGGGEVLGRGPAGYLLHQLTWHVTAEAARRTAGRLVVLHAGAVARGDRVVVLPGASGSGKSTLVAGLVAAGWGYLGDELVGVDPVSLTVVGAAKPVTVKPGSFAALAPLAPPAVDDLVEGLWLLPPEQLRPGCVVAGGRPAAVVLPRWDAAAGGAAAPVPRARAVAALADATFGFLDDPAGTLEVLTRLAAGCACVEVRYPGLAEGVSLLEGVARGLDTAAPDGAGC